MRKLLITCSLLTALIPMSTTLTSCGKIKEAINKITGKDDASADDEDADKDKDKDEEQLILGDEMEEIEEPAESLEDNTLGEQIAYVQSDMKYYASGYISDLPCSFDIAFDPDGNASGTFWNMLYNIKLDIRGRIGTGDRLELKLGSGSTYSQLALFPESEYSSTYTGYWGKDRKPVKVTFKAGGRDKGSLSGGTPLTIKGGGMTTHPRLVSQGSTGYLYFPNQPAGNRLPCAISGSTVEIYAPGHSSRIASFDFPQGGSGATKLYICNGKVFDLTVGS